MIPGNKYISDQGMKVVTINLVKQYHTKSEFENFNKWISGQTGLMMSNGDFGIYVSDYERWMNQGKLTEQLSHDWD